MCLDSKQYVHMMTAIRYWGDEMEFRDATRLGMWIYISDEDVSA